MNGQRLPIQNTGKSIIPLCLGILMVIGGIANPQKNKQEIEKCN